MIDEIEVKFLAVDPEKIRTRLKDVGAVCEMPMRLMKRAIIDFPDKRLQKKGSGHIRVRDEGNKITLAYKQHTGTGVNEAQEVETIVTDYQKTVELFRAIGMEVFSEQESRRETWKLGDTEIVLDEWPWLKPYLEIESDHESKLKETAKILGLDWDDGIFGDVMVAYRAQYPQLTESQTVGSIQHVRFNDPIPKMLNPIA